jgi:ribonuclease R
MAKRHSSNDPHAEREANKYENPIPSREFILDLLEQSGGPMNRNQLNRVLKLDDYDQVEALRRRLRAMERDGQIMRDRKGAYCSVSKLDLIRGRVSAHRDGFGFVIPDEGGEDLYLSAKQMSAVFDGDEVLCRSSGFDHRGKREGKIVEVLVRNTRQIVGRYCYDKGLSYVAPDNTRINHDIFVPFEETLDAQPGQYVMVEITEQPDWRKRPIGRITEVLGDHMAPGMEIDVAIRAHDIPHEWPEAVVSEAQALAPEPLEADKKGRVDIRQLPLVTIDGEDARDFDDAVYCEADPSGGWRLWVAIADVSHYVKVDSALDEEAQQRGNSVYFPERVVPMLPEALSNGLCSLKPQVDRLCMVCEMTISAAGKLTGYQFFEGVMHSHARLTYNQVGAMLGAEEKQHDELRQQYRELVPHLEQLQLLYKALRKARDQRGAIDFETTETRIVFGGDRKIEAIVPVVRNDAHKIIEECMLAANVAAANFFEKHELPALYRVHEGPTEQKLEGLRQYLGELGLDLGGGDQPGPDDYQDILAGIGERPDAHVIQTMLLRSMRQAVYQPDNLGHFGLHYSAYTHFTSPIRRYTDLLVHRGIRHIIRSERESLQVKRVEGVKPLAKKQIYPYEMEHLLAFGEQCSMTERRADDATREVVAWLKCEYLKDRVGEVFEGVIAAVTSFGLFVELVDVFVEGLVHISSLDRDYYQFDAVKQRLIGERSRTVFQLGDSITVQVARVSLDDKKIDLELAGGAPSRKQRRASNTEDKPKRKGKKTSDKPAKKTDSKKKAATKKKHAAKKTSASTKRGNAKKPAAKTAAKSSKATVRKRKRVK